MQSQAKRLAILSLPEAQELYSVPPLNTHEKDYFFTLDDDELAAVNRLHSHRNRIHCLLMLGYFKIKPVCLLYQWKDIDQDYRYIAERYYPSANKQKQNISRLTRNRLYRRVFELFDYARFTKLIKYDLGMGTK